MAYIHHGSIRRYTAALIETFNDLEVQYPKSDGTSVNKKVPLTYSTREKSRILDDYTAEQILSGNYNVLPRSSLALAGLQKVDTRVMNKNNKVGKFVSNDDMEFMYNSVPYEFTFDLITQCRGMNEATQIIEQIAPVFNPSLNIDVWDVGNLSEPTRVPVRLMDVSIEAEEYEELSTNLVTVSMSISLIGNLYPPIQSMPRIKNFQMYFNKAYEDDTATRMEMLEWDVDYNGDVDPDSMKTYAGSDVEIFTSARLLIVEDSILLDHPASGDILFNKAIIYDALDGDPVKEAGASINSSGNKVIFNASENLNGKYAVVSYLKSNL